MPLGVEGVQSLRAIPSSPLEQISAPSALFCLWRSQPGAFVPSGKAVLRLSPIGRQAPRGSREGCALSALLQKALTAAAQGLSFSPLPCPQPVPLDEALPKVAADSQGQVQALLWPLREGMGRGWEGTFPAPLTPERAHEQRQALGGDQQGQEVTRGSHEAP